MDRLHPVTATEATRLAAAALMIAALLPGCDDPTTSGEAPPGRFVAVPPAPTQATSPEDFCEVYTPNGGGQAFAFPELDGPAPGSVSGFRWVNVWATWCAPCVEEMPRLVRFRERLATDGTRVELTLISADSSAGAVTEFREQHRGTPDSVRFADPTALPGWASSVGLDEGATLPIHLFIDGGGRVRCTRTGALNESDYDAISGVVGG